MWETWHTTACNLSNITFHDNIHVSSRQGAFVRNHPRLYKHSLRELFTIFPGKLVLKLLCVKKSELYFVLFLNSLLFTDFCLRTDNRTFSRMQIKNKQRGLIQHFLICACPHCVVWAGFKQRSAINTVDDMLCNTVKDTVF